MQPSSALQPPPAAHDHGLAPSAELRPPPLAVAQRHPLRRLVIIGLLLLLVTGGVWRIVQTRRAAADKQAAAGGRAGGFPVPVVAGKVAQKDVPIYLDGLGTMQALNTVTVRARVDGQVEKIGFEEGQDVKQGDLIAQIDPAPFKAALDQVLAKQRQDEVQYENAQRDLQRDQDLIQKKVIAPQQLDYQQAQTSQFAAQVKNDAAAVDNARVQLAYTTISSPLNGRTGIRLVDQGNIVHASDATGIVVITQLHPISLVFTLPEQQLPELQAQQQATGNLKVLALAPDNKTLLGEGKLTVIDNQIDPTTGTIRLKAEFPNDDNKLWPGQFVNARVLVNTVKGGLVVPASVIQRGPENAYAYVIKPDQTVEMRPVKVGQIDQGEALVEDGLKPDEMVVVDGQYKLQPGSKVRLGDAPGGGRSGGKPGGAGGKPAGAGGKPGGPQPGAGAAKS